jgi:hypothetical protein
MAGLSSIGQATWSPGSKPGVPPVWSGDGRPTADKTSVRADRHMTGRDPLPLGISRQHLVNHKDNEQHYDIELRLLGRLFQYRRVQVSVVSSSSVIQR